MVGDKTRDAKHAVKVSTRTVDAVLGDWTCAACMVGVGRRGRRVVTQPLLCCRAPNALQSGAKDVAYGTEETAKDVKHGAKVSHVRPRRARLLPDPVFPCPALANARHAPPS